MLTYAADARGCRQTAGGQTEHERVRDQSYIKQYNLQTVMAILKKYQPISRTDISKRTGMSPTSVTRIVSALLNQGLIHESSVRGTDTEGNIRRGRKAIYLRVQDNGLYAVGIRLDKSVVQMCVTDFGDRILYRAESVVGDECTPEKMAQEAKRLFERIPDGAIENMNRIGAVGVCLSGSVNKWSGEVRSSRRMGWENVNIKEIFERTFALPVYVEDEIKACLIGEKVRMDIRDEVDTVYLYLGEEPGVAIVSNGMIVRGRYNEAGNIANIPIRQANASPNALLRMYLTEEGLLQQAQQKKQSIKTLEALICAYDRQEPWAEELIGNFRYHVQKTVMMISGLFDPQQIILGGELVKKIRGCFDASLIDERICFGGSHAEGCVSGAARIALRQAAVERIGRSAE